MAVVCERKIGNTTIRFHDDFCKDISPQKVEEILRRIALRAQAELSVPENRNRNIVEETPSVAS